MNETLFETLSELNKEGCKKNIGIYNKYDDLLFTGTSKELLKCLSFRILEKEIKSISNRTQFIITIDMSL